MSHPALVPADVLMNNAAIQVPTEAVGPEADWRRLLGVNLWGVIDGSQAFAPRMIDRGRPGLIINTGSKQGITTPPGNPACNVSKSGVKAYTEALQHQLRNTDGCGVNAHLLIPGFVWRPGISTSCAPTTTLIARRTRNAWPGSSAT